MISERCEVMEIRDKDRATKPVIKVEEWIFLILLGMIPILNLIVFTYFGFSRKIDPNKRNFSRAVLTYLLILTLLVMMTTILL